MKLTEKQRLAMAMAYAEEMVCEIDEYAPDMGGPHPRTVKALIKKGMLVEDPDNDESYIPTDAGRDALGIKAALAKKPKNAVAALKVAVALFVDDDLDVFGADEGHALPTSDDGDYDWDGVIGFAERSHMEGGEDVFYHAAATFMTECGFSSHAESANNNWYAFWPADDDE